MNTQLQVAEPERQPFNPSDHIMQIKSGKGNNDYLPVQWRLVWFRTECPQGTIDTEEIAVDLDKEFEAEVYAWNQDTRRSEKTLKRAPGYARFRAIVTDGKGGRATATKSERGVDFPDFVEKAETGAIGRALAALGYGTQFAPELNEEHRIVDAPVERSEDDRKAYRERKPFVEGTVQPKAAPGTAHLTNGDGSPAFVTKPHTLMEVKEFFLKYFKATQWRGFKDSEIGAAVEDSGLSDAEVEKLWARLQVIDEDAQRRAGATVAAAN